MSLERSFKTERLWLAGAAGLAVLWIMSWLLGPNVSSSAADLLWRGRGSGSSVAPLNALFGTSWAKFTFAALAGLNLLLGCLLTRRHSVRRAWLWLPLVWLVWGPTRELLTSVSLESVLFASLQLSLWAAPLWRTSPWLAAAAVSVSGVACLGAGPAGLMLAPFALAGAIVWRAKLDDEGLQHEGALMPWLVAVSLAVASLWLLVPGGAVLSWWQGNLQVLRTPVARPTFGSWATVPSLGPLLGVWSTVPAVALAVTARRREWAVWTLAAAVSLVAVTLPGSHAISSAQVILGLLTPALLGRLSQWCERSSGTWRVGLSVAVCFAVWADCPSVAPSDHRSALGRVLTDAPAPGTPLPAVLTRHDLATLNAVKLPTRILPSRHGARALARALHKRGWLDPAVQEWDAFSAKAVLVHTPAKEVIGRAWMKSLKPLRCHKGGCLLDNRESGIKGR